MTQTENLLSFLDASVSAYHAVAYLEELFQAAGYVRLLESAPWALVPGGKYYLTRGGSSIFAFRIPEGTPTGFLMSAAHCDRPAFKLKENGELAGKYTRQSVEKYGGMILSTWLDRPLSIAGRVMVETEKGIAPKLVNLDRDLLLIPNVAIHMNRKVNEGYAWNPATDLLPLVGSKEAAGKLEMLLEEAAGGKLLGRDLYLYIRQKACRWGLEEEYISAQALDDLQCVWGCAQGFLKAQASSAIPVLAIFDSEEVGSCSAQGAGSDLMETVLSRICGSLGLCLSQLLAQSFLVSADNAHALHPNHPEYSDPNNAPVVNGGIVIKHNGNLRYCTDGLAAAIFRSCCQRAGVNTQTYYNRADLPGGSTLGCIAMGHVSVPTVDIGLAQLAMHSCYETAGVKDSLDLEKAMAAYYGSTLLETENGWEMK